MTGIGPVTASLPERAQSPSTFWANQEYRIEPHKYSETDRSQALKTIPSMNGTTEDNTQVLLKVAEGEGRLRVTKLVKTSEASDA